MNTAKILKLLPVVLATATPALAAQSIVGTWAPDPGRCTPVDGTVSIGAKSLTADEMSCTFDTVARSGDVVTWTGRCSDGMTRTPATVTAVLRDRRLTVTVNGQAWESVRRCR